jgi:hypothetical protein
VLTVENFFEFRPKAEIYSPLLEKMEEYEVPYFSTEKMKGEG